MYSLLIVDDELQILEGLKRTLPWDELAIAPILTAQTYQEAIDKAVEYEPDLALCDVCLGEYRGYDLIDRLGGLGLRTRYVMMSGYEEFEYVRKAMNGGARGYLLKPINRGELRQVLTKVIVEELGGRAPAQADDGSHDPVLGLPYEALGKLTRKMLLLVQADFHTGITLKTVAEQFRMNSTYLGQLFLKESGIKFSEYVTRYRLLQARKRIEGTREKVGVIAHQVGYHNMSYFYAQFREEFSISPSDLRSGRPEDEA